MRPLPVVTFIQPAGSLSLEQRQHQHEGGGGTLEPNKPTTATTVAATVEVVFGVNMCLSVFLPPPDIDIGHC